jgi:uncharacterized OsmC-like protein
MIPRISKHSVVAVPAGGQAVNVSVRGHTVHTDQPASSGGADSAPTPLEMMSVALSACVALYVRRFCDSNGLDTGGLAVEVNPVWNPNPGRVGRFDVLLHVPADIPLAHRESMAAVARSCPVHHTLAHGSDIALTIVEGSPDPERDNEPSQVVAAVGG